MPDFQRILAIVNPVAGIAQGQRIAQRMQKRLEGCGIACEIQTTQQDGDAARWAQSAGEEGFDLILAIGGDGTVGEVVAGLVRTARKIPVAHIPVGTANVIAMALSLSWRTRAALDVVRNGKIVPFDVGYLPTQERYFLLMAAIGYPARVIQDSPRQRKKLLGFLAYAAAGIRHLFLPGHAELEISTERGRLRINAHTVLIANIGRIKDLRLKLTPDSSPHDGRFDISIISSRTFWDLLKVLLRLLTWRYRPPPKLRTLDAARVRVSADPPLPVQIDGELLGFTPFICEVLPSAIQLVVPQRYE